MAEHRLSRVLGKELKICPNEFQGCGPAPGQREVGVQLQKALALNGPLQASPKILETSSKLSNEMLGKRRENTEGNQ